MSGYEAFLVDITDSESNISGEISGSAQKALQDILSESEIKNLLFRAVGNIPYDDDPITEYSYTYSTSSLYPLIYDEKCTYSGSEGSSHKINISSAVRAGADNPSLNTDEQYALTGSAVGKFIINGSGNILRSFDITESLTGVYVTVRDGATVKTSVTRSTYKEITVSRG